MKLFKKDAHFYKKVFVLGFPIALQTLVTVFVGMLDNIMLSHYSQDTFSAASLANAYVMIPNEDEVAEGKEKLLAVLEGE